MIGIITYDAPHRKTQDLIFHLLMKGYRDIHLLVLPWVKRKNFQPLYIHRPSVRLEINIDTLCKRLDISFSRLSVPELSNHLDRHPLEAILIGGSGILPAKVVKNNKIINAHPGYLPYAKGLDALKWSIYHNYPLGATTHFISEDTDQGVLIDQIEIPILKTDSFHSIARRVYEMEIQLLAESIEIIDTNKALLTSLRDDQPAFKRMPNSTELEMMKRLQIRLDKKVD